MTPGAKELTDQALRQWAVTELNFADNISADQARLDFWRCIDSEWDLSPPATWHDAAAVVAAPKQASERPLCRETIHALHAKYREAIEQFAETFFAVPPAQRKQRWQQLRDRCADIPHLMGRLNFLAVGLEVEVPRFIAESKQAGELSTEIMRMFVLRPAQRAYARQAVIAKSKEDPAAWEAVVRELKQHAPQVVDLEAALTSELLTWKAKEKRRRARLAVRRKASQPVASKSSGSSVSVATLVIIAISLISGLVRFSQNSSRSQNPPVLTQRQNWNGSAEFNRQMREYLDYLHQKRDARARGDFQEMWDPEDPNSLEPPNEMIEALLVLYGYQAELKERESHLAEQRARKAIEEYHGASTGSPMDANPDAP